MDPDQVLWNNIGFSIQEQNVRAVVAVIVQVLTAVLALLFSLLLEKLAAVTATGSANCAEADLTVDVMAGAADAYQA